MKKIFNLKQKGFTLVEMLGVIIVLAFLSFLVSEVIINNVKKTNKKLEIVAKDLIISSGREYVELNPNLFPKVLNKSYYISFETLKQNNLIREDMLPKIDTIDTLKSKYVLVIYNGNNYTYDLVEQFSIMVKINPNGGTYNGSSDIYSFEELASSTIKLKTPKRSGYIFDRWVADVEDVVIDKNNITLTEQTVTLTAEWVEGTFEYAYSEDGEQTFIVPKTGYYKLETWGAQGGSYSDTIIGGYGGYSTGIIYLEKGQTLYINVGESGVVTTTKAVVQIDGGYNGGGYATGSTDKYVGSGGGATHIALSSGLLSNFSDNLYDLLIVAGGGGGSSYQDSSSYGYGGVGGGILGGDGTQVTTATWTNGTGGSQLNGGTGKTSGSFGAGGSITEASGTGGGGGYYGGGSGQYYFGAGGGSGYIGNSKLTFKYMYCYNCKESSGNSTKTISTTNVSETAQSDYAKINDGYARITFVSLTMKEEITAGEYVNYDFIGKEEIFEVPKTGYYKIELWGAQGGSGSYSAGGNGAYTSGILSLNKNELLYLYVGSQTTTATGGYNGGGSGTSTTYRGGGGATDIRYFGNAEITNDDLLWNSTLGLNSRIMVAAGGGSSYNYSTNFTLSGGEGGTLMGISGKTTKNSVATGGTQTSGGVGNNGATAYSGSFGQGGNGNSSNLGTAGGGGYYGGGGTYNIGSSAESGAGGSSYISGYTGCVAITSSTSRTAKSGCSNGTTDITCSYHYSGKIFEETVMKAGNEEMPTQDGTSTMTGNTGNGFAKITYIGEVFEINVETKENFVITDITINIISSSKLDSENKYQYYISTSNTELIGGEWKEYTSGESFNVSINGGRYYLWIYPISTVDGKISDNNTDINTPYVKQEFIVLSSKEYAYSGGYEEFVAPKSGEYKIYAYGAQGGVSGDSTGGKGAYVSGTLYLDEGEKLYIYVGGSTTNRTGGYNGGGTGSSPAEGSYIGYGGGGATDIRYFGDTEISDSDLAWNSTLGLNSRIMVAAGGGGGAQWVSLKGAPAGGLNGNAVYTTTSCDEGSGGFKISGATQTSGYSFGIGRNAGGGSSVACGVEGRGGGGAGYYGGSAQTSSGINTNAAGASGSSYISGYTGCVAITSSTSRTAKSGCSNGTTDITCSYHYSGKVFTDTEMKAGNETMPTQDGTSTMTGNTGNGFARITYVG